MNDPEFDRLCEENSFGAVARGEFPLVPRQMLKALVEAAVAATQFDTEIEAPPTARTRRLRPPPAGSWNPANQAPTE